jgi:hypothetical protein
MEPRHGSDSEELKDRANNFQLSYLRERERERDRERER